LNPQNNKKKLNQAKKNLKKTRLKVKEKR